MLLSSPIQKREVDKSSSSESFSPPYEEIKNAWNTTVSRLPQLKAISEKRKRVIDKLWLKFPDLEIWKLIFKKADNNDFLTDNQTYIKKNSYEGWKADFDYITREEVFMRIYEGSFDG